MFPKTFVEQKKSSIPGNYKYVLKQDNAEMKGKAMMTEVPDYLKEDKQPRMRSWSLMV